MAKLVLVSYPVCLLAFVLFASNTIEAQVTPNITSRPFNRTLFPRDFIFGAGTAAYQMEGAAYIDGKGPSIWDHYTKYHPERIVDGSNGDVASDFYHRYKEDVRNMKIIGLDSFRFSISWPRVLPTGKISGGVNQKGVQFYNSLINELLSHGILPYVTIFHWDVPQALEEEYGGFRSPNIVKDFQDFTEFLFNTFGDRVKYWCTINEPSIFTLIGYNNGLFAPGRCSDYVGDCLGGDSATEPYIVGHNLLLSHAAAVKVYKEKFQASQKGQIGITLVTEWYKPKYKTQESIKAASRALDFMLGWFLDPITHGDYPKTMRDIIKDRLPKFKKSESESLIGSFDFLGMNYYSANYADALPPATANFSFNADMQANLTLEKNGVAIGKPTNANTSFMNPEGLRELALYIKEKYNNPPLYITENGVGDPRAIGLPVLIKDSVRIKYFHGHMSAVLDAIKQGAKVKAYYVWAFLDTFEWKDGYTRLFGLNYVDFKSNDRQFKSSAYWYKRFLLK